MKTKVLGKIIENIYSVNRNQTQIKDTDGNFKDVYTGKPTITKETMVKEWSELCSFEGAPRYNLRYDGYVTVAGKPMNISEKETVYIDKEIFRADLNELHLHTNKIVEERDVDKEDALSILAGQIKAFNKMMIESNDRLKTYCDLHKLSYEDTDCIELFKLVFPDDEYVIKDGIMKIKGKSNTYNVVWKNDAKCFADNATSTAISYSSVTSPNTYVTY